MWHKRGAKTIGSVLMSAATVPVKYTPKANWGKEIKAERSPEPSDKAPMQRRGKTS